MAYQVSNIQLTFFFFENLSHKLLIYHFFPFSLYHSSLLSPSPKQYALLELKKDLALPLTKENDTPFEHVTKKRAKGVKRGIIQDTLSENDFYAVSVLGHQSRSVTSFGFKKFFFNIFLNESKRQLLTRGNSKRIFFPSSRLNESYFSFPLFVPRLIESIRKKNN